MLGRGWPFLSASMKGFWIEGSLEDKARIKKDEAAGIKSTIRTNRECPTWSGRDPGNHWRGAGVLVVRVKGSEGGCEGEERCYLKGGGDLSLHLRKHRVRLGEDL